MATTCLTVAVVSIYYINGRENNVKVEKQKSLKITRKTQNRKFDLLKQNL